MRRFAAVVILAVVGLFAVPFVGYVMALAFINAFVAAVLLPLVLNPTRRWSQAFWQCFDMVYGAVVVCECGNLDRLRPFSRFL